MYNEPSTWKTMFYVKCGYDSMGSGIDIIIWCGTINHHLQKIKYTDNVNAY